MHNISHQNHLKMTKKNIIKVEHTWSSLRMDKKRKKFSYLQGIFLCLDTLRCTLWTCVYVCVYIYVYIRRMLMKFKKKKLKSNIPEPCDRSCPLTLEPSTQCSSHTVDLVWIQKIKHFTSIPLVNSSWYQMWCISWFTLGDQFRNL